MSYFSRNMDPEDLLKEQARVKIFKKSGEDQLQPVAEFHCILDPDKIVDSANKILDKKIPLWRNEKQLYTIKVILPFMDE
jgi:hypothetical protein